MIEHREETFVEVSPRLKVREIRPQSGPQERFLKTEADIAVYGGHAGSGKTFALLMDPLHYIDISGFGAVIFRRTYPQITNEGALWDTSKELYPYCGARAKSSTLEWVFPSRCRIKFGHMQREDDRYEWDGAQVPLIAFDQLEHFTRRQFFYMLSRNRSVCGIRPYVRATCNPRPDHWLREFMRWWIDDETGYVIWKRSGVMRWFVVQNDVVDWADSPKELIDRHGSDVIPKSFTFIPGRVTDNKILLEKDPSYLSNLQALPHVERMRLFEGNWNVRETAGSYFQRDWFEIVDAAPSLVRSVRYWDRAATEGEPGVEVKGSWTAGLRMGQDSRGVFYITDVTRFRRSALGVETAVKNVATQDGTEVTVGLEQDPGQAGKAEVLAHVRNLAGFVVEVNAVRESKGMRAKPLSAQVEAGNVKLVRGSWNEPLLRELENFDGSDRCVSDQVDAASGAFYLLTNFKRAGVWGR